MPRIALPIITSHKPRASDALEFSLSILPNPASVIVLLSATIAPISAAAIAILKAVNRNGTLAGKRSEEKV